MASCVSTLRRSAFTSCRDRSTSCPDRSTSCRDRSTSCRDRSTSCRDRPTSCRDRPTSYHDATQVDGFLCIYPAAACLELQRYNKPMLVHTHNRLNRDFNSYSDLRGQHSPQIFARSPHQSPQKNVLVDLPFASVRCMHMQNMCARMPRVSCTTQPCSVAPNQPTIISSNINAVGRRRQESRAT